MQVKLQDLSRVIEVRMRPRDRYDTPSLITDHLRRMYDEATQHPRQDKVLVTQTLCGVDLRISARSNLHDVGREVRRALQGFIPPEVGPTPKKHLSKADFVNDNVIRAANLALEDAFELELRPKESWEEPFLKSKDLSVFDRAMLTHSTRLGRTLQAEMGNPRFDPEDEEVVIPVVVKVGLPMADFDYSCHLFRYSVDRLMQDWYFRGAISPLYNWTRSSISTAEIVSRVRSAKDTPVEYAS